MTLEEFFEMYPQGRHYDELLRSRGYVFFKLIKNGRNEHGGGLVTAAYSAPQVICNDQWDVSIFSDGEHFIYDAGDIPHLALNMLELLTLLRELHGQ